MRLCRIVLGAAMAVALAGAGPIVGWQRALPDGGRLQVEADPVSLHGGELPGLEADGAWVLHSAHPKFGGLSALHVDGDTLYALTDLGWWFGATLAVHGRKLRLEYARLAPMLDANGKTYTKAGGDAEGLAVVGDRLAVSFEEDHRVMFLGPNGRLGGTIHAPGFKKLPPNKGLEALATLPDGRLIGLAETRDAGGVPIFLIDPAGSVSESHLPPVSRHAMTGADVGPDGRLYLVLRDFSLFRGLSIRVMRYRLGSDDLPVPASAETLAAFEQGDGIDNMEGISVERAPGGGMWLWLVSDDNFNEPLQRTLLLRFKVRE